MTTRSETPELGTYQGVVQILGGEKMLHHKVRSPLDVHRLVVDGLPGASLMHLVTHVGLLSDEAMLKKAIGISVRTLQRRKGAPPRSLNSEQGGKAWKFAELLNKATEILGSQQDAEQWLATPAIALEQQAPIDLLSTPTGVELVEDLLERMEYGVYA